MGQLLQVNQELQARLQCYERAFDQMRLENLIMHEKLLQLGVNVLDLVNSTNCNGSSSAVHLLKSPATAAGLAAAAVATTQRSPSEKVSPTGGHHGYPIIPLSVMQSHLNLEKLVKKERESCT